MTFTNSCTNNDDDKTYLLKVNHSVVNWSWKIIKFILFFAFNGI